MLAWVSVAERIEAVRSEWRFANVDDGLLRSHCNGGHM
jgi:hypothetical protein